MLNKPQLTESEYISNNGFWPDLDLAVLIDGYGTPSEFEPPLIKENLVTAMIDINRQLEPVKKKLLLLGFNSLENYIDVNPNPINDTDALLVKYQQAVFSYCIAALLLQFKTVIRKPEAENMAKDAQATFFEWQRKSNYAVMFFFNQFLPDSAERPYGLISVELL